MTTIPANLQAVNSRISDACASAGREPGSVTLLAVSKGWPAETLRAAMRAGQRTFGESYVQEALGKIKALADQALEWHFIGPVQGNKTRAVAENFAWVHSVDRVRIAERLSEQRPDHLPPIQACIQVNVSGEASKNGCDPAAVADLARAALMLPRLRLRGLMAMPEPTGDLPLLRRRFASLRLLRDQLNAGGLALDTLSMGMSQDFESAILEGATIVRVGTAIFGERQ